MNDFLDALGAIAFVAFIFLLLAFPLGYFMVEADNERCKRLAGIEKAVKHEKVYPYCVITHSNGEIEKLYIGG